MDKGILGFLVLFSLWPPSGQGLPATLGIMVGRGKGSVVSTTKQRTAFRTEPPSRRLEEIRELEAIWSISRPGTAAEARPTLLRTLRRYRVALCFAAGWIAFMTVLLGLAPAADPLTAPDWVTHAGGLLATALMVVVPLGIMNRALGYGASVVGAGAGMALAVGCFSAGHTGFWPSYQLAGFALLAAAGGTMLARLARR